MAELKRKQYMYNFTTGGWNTVWGKTKKGAIRNARNEWKKQGSNLEVDVNTFKVVTSDQVDEMLMMTR
tara:strand:- start:272 stop:475 length:204 start_codon:yes stop_codon:yes gene_type:complete